MKRHWLFSRAVLFDRSLPQTSKTTPTPQTWRFRKMPISSKPFKEKAEKVTVEEGDLRVVNLRIIKTANIEPQNPDSPERFHPADPSC
jgi:hypothetical protein